MPVHDRPWGVAPGQSPHSSLGNPHQPPGISGPALSPPPTLECWPCGFRASSRLPTAVTCASRAPDLGPPRGTKSLSWWTSQTSRRFYLGGPSQVMGVEGGALFLEVSRVRPAFSHQWEGESMWGTGPNLQLFRGSVCSPVCLGCESNYQTRAALSPKHNPQTTA